MIIQAEEHATAANAFNLRKPLIQFKYTAVDTRLTSDSAAGALFLKQLASRTAAAEEAKLIRNHDEVWMYGTEKFNQLWNDILSKCPSINPQGSGRTDQTAFEILMQDTTACYIGATGQVRII